MNQEIKDRVCAVLDSGFLTEGAVTREFEAAVAQFVGCQHAIAVTSCTTGLEIALRAIGIGPGDEVIVPDYTYPATADIVAIVGATPVILDIDPETMLMDYAAAATAVTSRTKAMIPVSAFGNPLNYDRLRNIRRTSGILIVEDAAPALGAEYHGQKVGTLADLTVFSFHPRKFITTGEGGIITTNNGEWADWIRSYKHFGVGVHERASAGSFQRIGTNSKMSDVLAAVGLVQMRHVHELLARRVSLSERYISLLKNIPGVSIPATTPNGFHSRQSFCVYVEDRDAVMTRLRERGIEVQIGTYALHKQPAFAENRTCRIHGDLSGSSYAFEHCLALPLYHDLSEEDQDTVVAELERAL
jgi:dTDP-4-amino-4,6-dideoxygalactose transaminase